MPDPSLLTPDRMPLREALRSLRHVLRRGGRSIRDAAPTDVLPRPASRLAQKVLRDVEGIARSMDDAASDLAERMLGDRPPSGLQLHALAGRPEAAKPFAAAVYAALRAVLARLGAEGAYVSEAAARRAWETLEATSADDAAIAAHLALALVEAKVIRDASAEEAARVPGAALQAVSVFAVLLWLLSDRAGDEDDAALEAAVNLSVALAGDVARATETRDATALSRLFGEFADHV
jgi:hypothetical protein